MTDERMELLRRLLERPGAGYALPPWTLSDARYSDVEIQRTFGRDWIAIASEGELSQPGSYVTADVGGEPIVVLRGRKGALRALSNLCQHRGSPLLDGSGTVKRIQCPYHRWTYKLDGAFVAAPFDDDGADRARRCLPQFAVEVWNGVVFVSMAKDPEPLAERLRGIEDHLPMLEPQKPFKGWSRGGEDEHWRANWKIVFENAAESYHLFAVHAETLEKVTPTRGAYFIEGDKRWSVTGGITHGDTDYRLVSIPPSFVGIFSKDAMIWLSVLPQSVDRSRIRTGMASPWSEAMGGGASKDERAWFDRFMAEDKRICEWVQRGQGAKLSEPGALLEAERVLGDFHRYLGARLFPDG